MRLSAITSNFGAISFHLTTAAFKATFLRTQLLREARFISQIGRRSGQIVLLYVDLLACVLVVDVRRQSLRGFSALLALRLGALVELCGGLEGVFIFQDRPSGAMVLYKVMKGSKLLIFQRGSYNLTALVD